MNHRRVAGAAVGLYQALLLVVVTSCGPSMEEAGVSPPPQEEVQELRAGGGPVILGGDDLTDHGSISPSGELRDGWFYIYKALLSLKAQVRRPHDGTIAVLGADTNKSATCCDAGAAYYNAAPMADLSPALFEGSRAINNFFDELKAGQRNPAILVIAGTGALNDIDPMEGQTLRNRAVDIADFVNAGGGLLAHGSGPDAYGWLQALIPGIVESEQAGCDVYTLTLTPEGEAAFPGLTNSDIQAGPCHSSFSGDLGGLQVLAADGQRRVIILGGAEAQLPGIISLTPASATHEIGTVNSHTVTATVRNSRLEPIPGATITFSVGTGPNAGRTGTGVSNASGQASFTYTSNGQPGTDLITARFVDPTGTTQVSPAVEAIWVLRHPPDARCQDVTVQVTTTCGAMASVNNGSSDPDGDAITCAQTPAGPYGPGSQQVTLTCTDAGGLSASCSATVTVVDVQPPRVACPLSRAAECTGNLSASVSLPPATVTDNCSAPSSVGGGVATYPMGETAVPFTASDSSGNTSTCHTSVTVVDTLPPSLALVGPSELVVACGGSVTDGVVATDVCGGDLSSRVQAVGISHLPGTYQVSYRVTDFAGHTTEGLSRTVTVLQASGETSVVLNGDSSMVLECGVDTWVDPGAVATDSCGAPLEVHRYNTGDDDGDGVPGSEDPDDYGPGPDTSAEGTYSVQYLAWDEQWHISSAILSVTVADRIAPVVTLNGPGHIVHTCGSAFVDPGASASDACYGDLTVQRYGDVNGWVAGTYLLQYMAWDSAGNGSTPALRQVDVVNCPW